jgi:hypothetical protein
LRLLHITPEMSKEPDREDHRDEPKGKGNSMQEQAEISGFWLLRSDDADMALGS